MTWLRAFCLLFEKENYSEVADEMYISASSLSKYIKAIEARLGKELIDRSKRNLRFTRDGVRFYHYASSIIFLYEKMLSEFADANTGSRPTLSIGMIPAASGRDFFDLLQRYVSSHQEIKFSFFEYSLTEAMKKFKDNQLDFVLVRTNLIPDLDKYNEIRLLEDEIFFYSNQKEYANTDEISLKDILNCPMVFSKEAFDEMRIMLQRYNIDIHDFDSTIATGNFSIIFDQLASGTSNSLMSKRLAKTIGPENRLRTIPLKEHPVLSLGLLSHVDNISAPVTDMIAYIRHNTEPIL